MWREFISVHSLPSGCGKKKKKKAEKGKSTIKARGEMGVRLEALNNPKNHLNMCDGARVSGITGERQQVLPGLCFSFSALSLKWNSVRLAQNFLSHSTPVDLKAPSSERYPGSPPSALASLLGSSPTFPFVCWMVPSSCPADSSN